MIKKFKTIKSEIIFTYSSVFIITLLFLNILVYFQSMRMVIDLKKDSLSTSREFFLENINELYSDGGILSKDDLLKEISKTISNNKEISIKVTKDSGDSVGTLPIDIPINKEDLFNIRIINGGEGGNEFFYLIEVLEYEEENYIFQYILSTDYESYFEVLIKVIFLVEAIGIIISILLSIKIANKVVGPINKISDITEAITADNLTHRIPEDTETLEIKRLSNLINTMLERLEKSFENQKEFMSNVSHELRTPISVIKGYIDLYKRIGPEDRELLEESMLVIEEENESMKRMIEKLLFLSRSEIGDYSLNINSINVRDLFERLKRDYTSINKDQLIKITVEDDKYLLCDSDLTLQMLRALMDNGIKYGNEKGLEIGYEETIDTSIIYVEDFGKGMTPSELENIFNRFYKSDKSRNRDSGSMGLGLSIVEKISELHHCRIEVKSQVNQGSIFKIIFKKENNDYAEDTHSRG